MGLFSKTHQILGGVWKEDILIDFKIFFDMLDYTIQFLFGSVWKEYIIRYIIRFSLEKLDIAFFRGEVNIGDSKITRSFKTREGIFCLVFDISKPPRETFLGNYFRETSISC